jgi:outer membrane immunogenic protein
MKRIAVSAAALAFASSSMTIQASAADYDLLPPAPSFQPTWQGFYFGAHVGHGGGDFAADARVYVDNGTTELARLRRTFSAEGLVGGVQAGYNWQMGSLVLGIEGDVSFPDWGKRSILFDTDKGDFGGPFDEVRGVVRASGDADFLATVRGRLGMAFDGLLIYGTGGVAFTDAVVRGSVDVGGVSFFPQKKTFSEVGFVVGGGVGWMVIPHTFSLGLEGLYYVFNGKKTLYKDEFEIGSEVIEVRARAEFEDAWVVRARADVHF